MQQINDCGVRAISHDPDMRHWRIDWRPTGGASDDLRGNAR